MSAGPSRSFRLLSAVILFVSFRVLHKRAKVQAIGCYWNVRNCLPIWRAWLVDGPICVGGRGGPADLVGSGQQGQKITLGNHAHEPAVAVQDWQASDVVMEKDLRGSSDAHVRASGQGVADHHGMHSPVERGAV